MRAKILTLATISAAALLTACGKSGDDAAVSAQALTEHVRVLSSDEYEGRAPASAGEIKTLAYIEGQFAKAGFKPGAADGGWRQPVTLNRFELMGPVALSLTVAGTTKALTQGAEAVVSSRGATEPVIKLENAPLVFVGYGVSASDKNWDDYKGVDLKGKVAVVLVNDPDFETPQPGAFSGKAMTYYGRWTYKFEELARHGAAGALIIHETVAAGYGWDTVKNSWSAEQYDIQRADIRSERMPLEGWIQHDTAEALFKDAGLDLAKLKEEAKTAAFQPVPLPGATFSAEFAVEAKPTVTNNVIAILEGTKRPKETVIYSAHWDHLGVGLADAKGDRIYNGALDNATGVATLLELARMFGAGPKPERSIVLLAVTAEEKGLLGSEFYATNPIYPLETTVADLNFDGLNIYGAARDIQVVGSGKSELEDMLAKEAKAKDLMVVSDQLPEVGGFYRSDQFNFAKKGVPVLYLKAGEDLLKGGAEAGKAAEQAYRRERYHQPADEWSESWNLDGAVTDIGMMYRIGRDLANSSAWPNWRAGDEFRALRDASAAARK